MWLWIVGAVGVVLLGAGAVLAMATTTSNRMQWAVLAPLVFGTGTLLLTVAIGNWSPIAVTAGMYFYAAINYRTILRARSKRDTYGGAS